MVKVKAQFKRRSTANNVEIYVPVPDDADTPRFRVNTFRPLCQQDSLLTREGDIQASTGSVQYVPDKSAFVWKIKQLGGGREFLMRAHFGLPSVRGGAPRLFCVSHLHRYRCMPVHTLQNASRWTSARPSRSNSRSRTSLCLASRCATSRSLRRAGTRLCLGCGTSRKTEMITGARFVVYHRHRIRG